MLETNKIYCMDCLEGMAQIEDNKIDLIITSPTYEDIAGAGYTAKSKDKESYNAFWIFTTFCLESQL